MNEQALKERIKNIAKLENKEFGEIWRKLVLERLLARISNSNHRDQFIFKGGLLLSHYIDIGRETKDADFLANQIEADISNIQNAFTEICSVGISDGFTFSFAGVSALDQPHMNYPGYRLSLDLKFGNKMKDKIQVDIGVGDIVDPNFESLELFQYKGKPIFEGSISLQVYPVETIFAEKLETVVSKGAANSRMKDFHDLLLICREKDFLDIAKLNGDIEKTFEYRNSKRDLPIHFSEDDFTNMQPLWSAHLRKLGKVAIDLNIPELLSELVSEVNSWLGSNQIGDV